MPANRISDPLLHWYDANARALPWRAPPNSGETTDPYGVWLSEIMLQQTNVAAAAPYWRRFRALWPSVEALAAADEAEVMREWAGLGYYARARNLLAAARVVAARGGFPDSEGGLRELPGIGPYTAAAIAAFAFGQRTIMVDANIERVGARLFAIETPLPAAKTAIAAALLPHVPAERPGDFGQALMDLGAAICTPRAPRCLLCPLAAACAARALGDPESFPRRPPKRDRPVRHGAAWWIAHGDEIALVRRPPKGLLGGMLALPGTAWGAEPNPAPPFPAAWREAPAITHVFTHFELRLSLLAAQVNTRPDLGQPLIWTPRAEIAGLPTLYKKAMDSIEISWNGSPFRSGRGEKRDF